MVALIVSGLGTVAGLWLFFALGGRLIGPAAGPLSAIAFGRRRSRPAAEAGSASAAVAVAGPPPAAAPPVAPPDTVEETDEDASGWGQAAHVWGGPIAGGALTFSEPPAPGVERRLVVSRLVAVRAEPDEMSRPNAERLDVGDEVEVLGLQGPYCQIRTPSGNEGWVPGLSLTAVSRVAEVSDDGG